MKKIVIVVDRAPCDGVAETLRMTAGLTMVDGNKPALFFVGSGATSAAPADDGAYGTAIKNHIEMLDIMQVPLVTDMAEGTALVAEADIVISG